MKTTRYFDEQVRRKRSYLQDIWIVAALAEPSRRDKQDDGRIRLCTRVNLPDGARWLRVVLLEDGETVHNAFFDRGYREEDE